MTRPPDTRRRAARLAMVLAAAVGTAAPQPAQAQAARTAPALPSLNELSASFEALATRVSPSVVQVIASGLVVDPDATTADGLVEQKRASGSGVIVDAAGFVVTNYHVVQGARRVQVVPSARVEGQSIVRPRGRTLDAEVAGVDEETDLALLKVSGATLAPLAIGDPIGCAPGNWCSPSAARSVSTTR